MKKTLFISVLILALMPIKSMAQNLYGTYYDWTVFTMEEPGRAKKCYISSFPKKEIGNHTKARKPYVLITRYEGKKIEEISIYNGYEYKINSEIYVAVDDQQYRMFTKDDVAWAKTMEQDKQMIEDILKGEVMKVRGESSVGTYSVDEYSLKGSARAYKKMKELCGE